MDVAPGTPVSAHHMTVGSGLSYSIAHSAFAVLVAAESSPGIDHPLHIGLSNQSFRKSSATVGNIVGGVL